MKGSRFSEKQVIGILREQEAGSKTADVCRQHGIGAAAAGSRCAAAAVTVGAPGGA
jgi:hypothetical protein